MKGKILLVWCLVFSIIASVSIQPVSARIQDVPTDHWAYQAVVKLVNKGYLAVYEDGTFQGTRAVDRYTLATTIAQILDTIEGGGVQGSASDVQILKELTTEFREELVQWYAERENVEQRIADNQRVVQVTEDRLSRVVASQVEMEENFQLEVQQLRNDLVAESKQLSEALSQQQAALRQHDLDLSKQGTSLAEHQDRINQLQEALIQLENRLMQQSAALGSLENWAGEKGAVFATMQKDDAQLRDSTGQLAEDITKLRDELSALAQSTDQEVGKVEEKVDILTASVAKTDGQFLKEFEQNRAQLQELQLRNQDLQKRNQELEKDLQSLAVRLQQEGKTRSDEVVTLQKSIEQLESQVGFSEDELAALSKKISEEISVQMNATLIREQRLERQLKELQDELVSFKTSVEKENKSIKSSATIAMVIAAVGVLVGFIGGK